MIHQLLQENAVGDHVEGFTEVLSLRWVDFRSYPFCSLFFWFPEYLCPTESWRLALSDLAYKLLIRALLHDNNWGSLEDLATVPLFYTLRSLANFPDCLDYRHSDCEKKQELHTQNIFELNKEPSCKLKHPQIGRQMLSRILSVQFGVYLT